MANPFTGACAGGEASEAVRAGVLEAICAVAPEVDPQRLLDERPLRRQVELDSMDWLRVIVGWHERFGVDIPEADYARLHSVRAVVDYMLERLGQARA
jgi:acyl carrier protein